jgi:hypothetical protein
MSLPPGPLAPPSDSEASTPARRSRRYWVTGAVVVVLAVISAVAVAVEIIGTGGGQMPAPTPTTAAAPVDPCARAACAVVPNVIGMTASQARHAFTTAGFTVPGALLGRTDESTVSTQTPSGLTKVPVTTLPVVGVYTPPAPARDITARDWALLAKNPGAHVGARVVVYGQVTQFDTATGTSAFRANVDGVVHKPRYGYVDYETNTMLTGTSTMFTDLVTDDLFRAEVTVSGSYSYETTMGGTMTVPKLEVTAVSVTGTAK